MRCQHMDDDIQCRLDATRRVFVAERVRDHHDAGSVTDRLDHGVGVGLQVRRLVCREIRGHHVVPALAQGRLD